MPSMLEALSQFGSFAIDPPKTMQVSCTFARDLPGYVQKVASDYLEYGISLNSGIAKIANENGLNDEQTQRIIAEANNQVYMTKYASLKNNSDRRVSFGLATKEGVMEERKPKLNKTASDHSVPQEKLNFFNYTPRYGFDALGTEKKTDFQKIAMANISQRITDIDEAIEKEAKLACGNIDTICDALCKYESMKKGAAQCYFGEMCKRACVGPQTQIMFKNAFEKKAETISGMPEIQIDIHEALTKKADYSLGDLSLQKGITDSFTKTVITDAGEYVQGVAGLAKIATEVEEQLSNIDELKSMRNVLETDVKNVIDNEE